MAFWTDAENKDPKRGYRFLVILGNMENGATWYAKKVGKPKFSLGDSEHKFLGHTFKYPGTGKWDDVTVTLVDPVSPDAAANTAAIIRASGYSPPADVNDTTTISKQAATSALGGVTIQQIDSLGNVIEKWTLWNAFVSAVEYGDLDYSSEDLTEVTLTLKYDWAVLETANAYNGAARTPRGTPMAGQKAFFKPGQSDE